MENNYGPEARNTDKADVASHTCTAGNSIEQVGFVPINAIVKPETEGWYFVAYNFKGEWIPKGVLYFSDKWLNEKQMLDFSHWLKIQ